MLVRSNSLRAMEKKRIVITGMGLLTPVGNSKKETWEALVKGKSGIDRIKGFDVQDYSCQIAGEVKNFDSSLFLDRKTARHMERFVQYSIAATREALSDACLEGIDKERIGVIIGAGIGGLRIIEEQHSILLEKGPRRVSPFLIPMLIPNMASGQIAIQFDFRGPNYCTVSACASGAHAIADSYRLLKNGEAEVMVAGGTESCITPLGLAGFCSAHSLSTKNDEPKKACCPFDQRRDGFIMAEGAGILILETLENAKKRNAHIYAEIAGAGLSADAYHMTAPPSDGKGAFLAMKRALENSEIRAEKIDYINAHGTSTFLNDKSETQAIKKVFGNYAYQIPVSSIKSMVGHMLGAAGAVEAAVSALVIENSLIPPTINYEVADPECDLDYVPNYAREKEVKTVISNSFGFGGHNIAIVIKKFKE